VQAAGSRGPSTPQTPLRMTQKNSGRDDTNWMRRFGTGTGFACAKLSEVLPRSERSLASVRMTELGKMEIKKEAGERRTKPFCAISSNRDEVPHLLLSSPLSAGVTPAQGGVEPTVGSTLNKVLFFQK